MFTPDNIPARGIRDITVADIQAAEKLDSAIKLIAWYNEGENGQMAAGVEPMLVSNANQLADVDDVFNAVLMKGDMLGRCRVLRQGCRQAAHCQRRGGRRHRRPERGAHTFTTACSGNRPPNWKAS